MTKFRFITNLGRSGYYKTWNTHEAKTLFSLLDFIFEDAIRIYDADVCGNDNTYIRVYEEGKPETEEYWVIRYSWWIEYDPEWNLGEERDYEKIDFNSIPEYYRTEYLVGDRDWMRV